MSKEASKRFYEFRRALKPKGGMSIGVSPKLTDAQIIELIQAFSDEQNEKIKYDRDGESARADRNANRVVELTEQNQKLIELIKEFAYEWRALFGLKKSSAVDKIEQTLKEIEDGI